MCDSKEMFADDQRLHYSQYPQANLYGAQNCEPSSYHQDAFKNAANHDVLFQYSDCGTLVPPHLKSGNAGSNNDTQALAMISAASKPCGASKGYPTCTFGSGMCHGSPLNQPPYSYSYVKPYSEEIMAKPIIPTEGSLVGSLGMEQRKRDFAMKAAQAQAQAHQKVSAGAIAETVLETGPNWLMILALGLLAYLLYQYFFAETATGAETGTELSLLSISSQPTVMSPMAAPEQTLFERAKSLAEDTFEAASETISDVLPNFEIPKTNPFDI
jgi:hypothetical protein